MTKEARILLGKKNANWELKENRQMVAAITQLCQLLIFIFKTKPSNDGQGKRR